MDVARQVGSQDYKLDTIFMTSLSHEEDPTSYYNFYEQEEMRGHLITEMF